MASHSPLHRPDRPRSATWPTDNNTHASHSGLASPGAEAFQDDLEQHPEKHFLSSLTSDEYYQGWGSDSDVDDDDDDDEGDAEWSAGIVDFSLFTADRQRALETGVPLPEKWNNFVSNQAEAFQRSVERVREGDDENVPALTPDTSPHLRDDLDADDDDNDDDDHNVDVESSRNHHLNNKPPTIIITPELHVPNYLTVEVKPSSTPFDFDDGEDDDDEPPVSFYFARKRSLAKSAAFERPGLRHARTLSGRRHVWRRPTDEIWTVGEEADAEARAEREDGRAAV